MGALRGVAWLCLGALCGCAAGGGPAGGPGAWEPDSSDALWGDEHPGLVLESEEWTRPPRGASVDVHGGDGRVVRVRAASHGVAIRASATPAHTLGMAEWRGGGALRHAAGGYLRPSVAEGLTVGDPRRTEAVAGGAATGLRLAPAASPWGAVRGGGFVLALGPVRALAAAWSSARAPSERAGAAGLEAGAGRTVAGVVVVGAHGSPGAPVVSAYAARDARDASVAGEVALARDGPRLAARAALGERRAWRGALFANAPRGADGADLAPARTRHGGSVERRDAFAGATSQLVLSTLVERDAASELERRRAAWNAGWRLDAGARIDLAARATRDLRRLFAAGPLVAVPAIETRDEWRLRVTLRARSGAGSGWRVENACRLELVEAAASRTGVFAGWTGTLDAGAARVVISAGGFALEDGQAAYMPNPGLVGEGAFAPLSGRGGSLSAAVRWTAGRHARLGATWAARGTARGRAGVYMSVDL